jgi:hypothetical protein
VFRNSWLLLTAGDYRNVRVRVLFRFAGLARDTPDAFLAISLRNQHFFANFGHMLLLGAKGRVWRTEPQDDTGKMRDVDIGEIPSFRHDSDQMIEMLAEFTDRQLTLSVGSMQTEVPVPEMPYVFGAGKVRIQTSLCRVQIREIELVALG